MKRRKFGKTGFDVSVIGFGGASVSGEGGGYGFGDISDSDSDKLIQCAYEKGINIFDTAPVYGFGFSEKRIGRAIKSFRKDVFVVSKCGVTWNEQKRIRMDNSPDVAQKMLDQSLLDLQTDYLDLYMIHWPDSKVDIRETMEVLAKAKSAGKIRFIGLCNSNTEEFLAASEVDTIEVLQSEYSLLNRVAEKGLFPLINQHDCGFMSWGTLGKGLLTGRVTRERLKRHEFDRSDCRSWAPWWKAEPFEKKFSVVEQLRNLINEFGEENLSESRQLLSLALSFVMNSSNADTSINKDSISYNVSTALCGMRSIEQLNSLCEALENEPSIDIVKRAALAHCC